MALLEKREFFIEIWKELDEAKRLEIFQNAVKEIENYHSLTFTKDSSIWYEKNSSLSQEEILVKFIKNLESS